MPHIEESPPETTNSGSDLTAMAKENFWPNMKTILLNPIDGPKQVYNRSPDRKGMAIVLILGSALFCAALTAVTIMTRIGNIADAMDEDVGSAADFQFVYVWKGTLIFVAILLGIAAASHLIRKTVAKINDADFQDDLFIAGVAGIGMFLVVVATLIFTLMGEVKVPEGENAMKALNAAAYAGWADFGGMFNIWIFLKSAARLCAVCLIFMTFIQVGRVKSIIAFWATPVVVYVGVWIGSMLFGMTLHGDEGYCPKKGDASEACGMTVMTSIMAPIIPPMVETYGEESMEFIEEMVGGMNFESTQGEAAGDYSDW